MPPKVSVIIPTVRGRENYLKEALTSIFEQTYQDFEIIIVSYGDIDLGVKDSRIKKIVLNKKGVSLQRNIGILHANGEYIAFLDDDDIWLKDKLEKQLKLIKRYDLIYTDYFIKYPDGKVKRKGVKIVCGKNTFEHLKKSNFISTSSVLVRKKVLEDVGMFDTSLTIGEDYDLWLRISEKYKIYGINEPLYIYRKPDRVRYSQYACGYIKFAEKWWNKLDPKTISLTELWYLKAGGYLSVLQYWYYKLKTLIHGLRLEELKELTLTYCDY